MNIIIAGGRDFDNWSLMKSKCDHLLQNQDDVTIISGVAKGADQLGEKYAQLRKLKLSKYPADWDRHGHSAGYKRNEIMAKNADGLIAFWDGRSKGTSHMINLARKVGLKVRVVTY